MLYQFYIDFRGNPQTEPHDVQLGATCIFGSHLANLEVLDAECGIWQAELPSDFVAELEAKGYAERSTGGFTISAEMP